MIRLECFDKKDKMKEKLVITDKVTNPMPPII